MLKMLGGHVGDWHRVTVDRVGSSKCELTHVSPNDPLQAATSRMMLNHFSQLPVLSKGEQVRAHDIKGMISWRSIAHSRARGNAENEVRYHMEKPHTVSLHSTLLEAMELVSRHDAVLVLDGARNVTGIVTIEDLNREFVRLTEPFLVVAQLEHQLRELASHLPFRMVQEHCRRDGQLIAEIADMELGDFVYLLSNDAIWRELSLQDHWDRRQIARALDQARLTRNDVMHFRPGGVSSARVRRIRDLTHVLADVTLVLSARPSVSP